MIPTMPVYVTLPDDYWNAPVIAAIPLGHGSTYAVVALDPASAASAFIFTAARVACDYHGNWTADKTYPYGTLRDAIARMCDLAGRPGCPSKT